MNNNIMLTDQASSTLRLFLKEIHAELKNLSPTRQEEVICNVRQHIYEWLAEVYGVIELITNDHMLSAIKKLGSPEEMAFMALDEEPIDLSPPTVSSTMDDVESPRMSSSRVMTPRDETVSEVGSVSRYSSPPPLIDFTIDFSLKAKHIVFVRWGLWLALIAFIFLSLIIGETYECLFNPTCKPHDLSNECYRLMNDTSLISSKTFAESFYVVLLVYSFLVLSFRFYLFIERSNISANVKAADEKYYRVLIAIVLLWVIYTINDYMIYCCRHYPHDLHQLHDALHTRFFVICALFIVMIITDRDLINKAKRLITKSLTMIKGMN